jgi:hypothetical protein
MKYLLIFIDSPKDDSCSNNTVRVAYGFSYIVLQMTALINPYSDLLFE